MNKLERIVDQENSDYIKERSFIPDDKYENSNCFQLWSAKLFAAIFSIDGLNNVIVDMNRKRIIGEFKGHILGKNTEGTTVVVYPSVGDNDQFDNTKIETINLLDLVNKSGSPK